MGAAALLLACLGLTACGHSSSTPQTQPEKPGTSDASGPTDRVAEPGAAKPTWAPDCDEISIENIDYISGARGKPSRAAALARYRKDGDTVVFSRGDLHTANQWLIVDDRGHLRAEVELLHTRHGWLPSTVFKCAE
jgi:hypothetical protein